jgi:hypothetical protein
MKLRAGSARDLVRLAALALCLAAPAAAAAADEISEALDASLAAQQAARESQQRVDRLDAEARALRDQRRAAEWRATQLADYATRLGQDALAQAQRRADLQAELARVAATGAGLLPLAQRMLAALEAHLERDLPFLADLRRRRLEEARAALADPRRGHAEGCRRVLEAWRREVEYGYTLGAEDAPTDCAGAAGASTRVHVGRVGWYCLEPDGARAARWDTAARSWQPLADGAAVEAVARAVALARGQAPATVLVLPVERGSLP